MDKKSVFRFSKLLYAILAVFMVVSICGCERDESLSDQKLVENILNKGEISLWVVTEETLSDGMNATAQLLIEQFEQQYENVTIRLDILPSQKEERAVRLNELRENLKQGTGPDIFLLPTREILVLDSPNEYTYRTIEPLFANVELAMQNGQFADISQLYDGDSELDTDKFEKPVMEAGTIGEARYVLPLRYDLPVIYAFSEDLREIGINPSHLDNNIDELMEYAISENNATFACGLEHTSLAVFSHLIDYEKMKVDISADTIRNYMQKFQALEETIGTQISQRGKLSLQYPLPDKKERLPLYIDQLNDAFTYLTIAQSEGKELTMHPLRSCNGDVVASVTYYGAISSSCQNTDAAYAFLRQFLFEDSQWERNRKEPVEAQHGGLIENGWPVRSCGSVVELWSRLKMQDVHRNFQQIKNYEFSDESVPILAEQIDFVRFPFPNSFRASLYSLNDFQCGNAASAVSIDELASNLISELDLHLCDK